LSLKGIEASRSIAGITPGAGEALSLAGILVMSASCFDDVGVELLRVDFYRSCREKQQAMGVL
jgi:hypothetical protein